MTASLARACAAHPWRTFAAWGVALVLAFAVIVTSLGDVLTTEGQVTNDPESELGYQLIGEHFPSSGDGVHEIVIVRSTSTPADREQLLRKAAEVDEAIEATGVVQRVAKYEESQIRHSSPRRCRSSRAAS